MSPTDTSDNSQVMGTETKTEPKELSWRELPQKYSDGTPMDGKGKRRIAKSHARKVRAEKNLANLFLRTLLNKFFEFRVLQTPKDGLDVEMKFAELEAEWQAKVKKNNLKLIEMNENGFADAVRDNLKIIEAQEKIIEDNASEIVENLPSDEKINEAFGEAMKTVENSNIGENGTGDSPS